MHKTQLALIGVCGATSLGLSILSAQAAPAASAMSQTMAAVGTQSKPQDVAYRRCWWRDGHRHCQLYDGPYRGYGYNPSRGYYGPNLPEAYPPGSSRRWDAQDRAGAGGRGRHGSRQT